jgi:hypothetical protein
MNKTSIQIAPSQASAPPDSVARVRKPAGPAKRFLLALASLRLTIVLFALSLVLVFFGTMAQMDEGLLAVLTGYFRGFIAWIPLRTLVRFGQVFFWFPRTWHLPGSFPFPGGYVIGGLLLLNLLAAHLSRFRVSWKRSGILILHAGLVLLLVNELLTGLFAVEARMTLENGESVNFVDESDAHELAFIAPSGETVVVPERFWRTPGLVRNDLLPVDVEVLEYWKNSDLKGLRDGAGAEEGAVTASDGRRYVVVRKGHEVGIDPNQRGDAPTVRVNLRKKGTEQSLGTYLLSLWHYPNFVSRTLEFPDQNVSVDGTTYKVALRLKRVYKPYTIYLKEFHHEKYLGTDTPKDFTSVVRLMDPARSENREVKIYMNNPLRYGGETFYQSGYLPGDRGTILQVVRNPAWVMPYVACTVVATGMLIHFGLHLIGFLRRRAAL